MAIGKVGSFATVEPALVDFGSMAERNIDKIKAEEQAKAQAKAAKDKADKEAAARIKTPENIKKTGIGAFDEEFSDQISDLWVNFAESKDVGNVKEAELAAFKIGEVGALADSVLGAFQGFQQRIEGEKDINPDAYNQSMSVINGLNKKNINISWDDNKNGYISVKNEEGIYPEPIPISDFVNIVFNIPKNYNELEDIKKVTNTILASKTEVGNYLFNKKITDINSEESKPQVDVLRNQAKSRAGSDSSMFVWYNNYKNTDKKLSYKVGGWTENERKEAEEHFFNTFLNAYNKEIEAGYGRPGGSSRGGSDVVLSSVVPYNYETSPQEQPKMNQFKASLPDLKGRQLQLTKGGSLPKVAGKSLALAYATPGDSPKFVFQLQDTDRFGFSGQGGTGGGSEAAYNKIAPGHSLYGEALSNTMAVFDVSTVKDLQTVLRGEGQTEAQSRGL